MKAKIVIMSHLSDIKIEAGCPDFETRNNAIVRAEFCKWVILKTGGDLNKEIDPDKMFQEFLNR